MRRPFFRKQTGSWYYVNPEGKFVNLGKDERAAFERWSRESATTSDVDTELVRTVLVKYWDWCKREKASSTATRRRPMLKSFDSKYGSRRVSDLKPLHVREWADETFPDSNSTTQNSNMSIIKGAFKWASSEGLIPSNPIASTKLPERTVRQEYLPKSRWQELLDLLEATPAADAVSFMLLTGARPQEVRIARPDHLDGDRLVFPIAESKGKKRSRVIYIPEEIAPRVAELAEEGRSRIFLTRRGHEWHKDNFNSVFRPLKKKMKLPWLCAYSCRHSFCAERLRAGVDPVIVAKLMGHADLSMLYKRYGHLCEATDLLRGGLK